MQTYLVHILPEKPVGNKFMKPTRKGIARNILLYIDIDMNLA